MNLVSVQFDSLHIRSDFSPVSTTGDTITGVPAISQVCKLWCSGLVPSPSNRRKSFAGHILFYEAAILLEKPRVGRDLKGLLAQPHGAIMMMLSVTIRDQ